MKLITTPLSLLVLLVVQVAMIYQSEFVTKYIISMRNHGVHHAPTYIAPTTTTACLDRSEQHFQSHRSEIDNEVYHNNICATTKSVFIPCMKEDHDFNFVWCDDGFIYSQYPEP
jgi:hypothetical protein